MLSALRTGRLFGAVGRNQLIGLKVFHPRCVHNIARSIIYPVKTQLLFIKYNQLHVLANKQQSPG
jgi:hypothetical protein